MDIATITTAYEGLKIGKDLLKGLLELKELKIDAQAKPRIDEVLSKLGDAQDTLFIMREELFRLQSENEEFRKILAESEKWEEKLAEYELVETSGGAIVYEFKDTPKHFICPSCVSKKTIEILQDNRTMSGKFRCVGCNAEFPIKPTERQKPMRAPNSSGWT